MGRLTCAGPRTAAPRDPLARNRAGDPVAPARLRTAWLCFLALAGAGLLLGVPRTAAGQTVLTGPAKGIDSADVIGLAGHFDSLQPILSVPGEGSDSYGHIIQARDLGVPFEGTPGKWNAITDVPGVLVGYTTLISGEGKLVVGKGPVRTGVTAILPRGRDFHDPVFAGFFSQNGNGEMTGIHWVKESGFLEGPVMITNTHSVGVVRDSVIDWEMRHGATQYPWSLPVVAETWDGGLNDADGFHVTHDDTFKSIDTAQSGPVAMGDVGGGTAMNCMGFKGGSGTASRVLPATDGGYVVGVFVQCNTGERSELEMGGIPVGRMVHVPQRQSLNYRTFGKNRQDMGSIIIVIATNAPLDSTQMDRLCKRATLGLGRVGGTSGDGSGDIFVSFSTANPGAAVTPPKEMFGAARTAPPPVAHVEMLPNWALGPVFDATIQATEEAIDNAIVNAKTMTGRDGHTSYGMPDDQLQAIMKGQYGPAAW